MAERWLVIDDSATIQRVIKLAFQGYDVQIGEADSCQDAVREIMLGQPSLVIADAALGGVQGVQDFLALKAQVIKAPFIILEGSYDNIDEAQFRSAGFRHFLKKPFDAEQLLSVTRQALGRALPYRGEAALGGPPAPPQHADSNFQSEETSRYSKIMQQEALNSGFDLGLQASRMQQQTYAKAMSFDAIDTRTMAETIISESIPSLPVNYQINETNLPSQIRLDHSTDAVRRPMSFSLEESLAVDPLLGVPARSDSKRDREGSAHAEAPAWNAMPRAAGSSLSNLLEPMLREEMEKMVRSAVEEYCRKHFAGIARELIQRELERLTQDRSRLLMD